MLHRMRKLTAVRVDEDVFKKARKEAKKYHLSFSRMTELLWRWYFDPEEAKEFAERLKVVEDFGKEGRK